MTKETIRVRSAAEIGEAIDRALVSAATAPSRPVYVEIPTDLLDEAVEEAPELRGQSPARLRAAKEPLARAAQMWELTTDVYLAGRACSGAGEAVARWRDARGAGDPHLIRVGIARARAYCLVEAHLT